MAYFSKNNYLGISETELWIKLIENYDEPVKTDNDTHKASEKTRNHLSSNWRKFHIGINYERKIVQQTPPQM